MNGRNIVTREGFRKMGDRVQQLADETADGALALIQEGGYQPSHLSFATLGVFEGVLGRTVDLDGYGTGDPFEFLDEPTELVDEWLDQQSTIMVNRPFSPVRCSERSSDVADADMESDEIPTSYVPFRNANLLSMATSYAEATDSEALFIGAHSEDFSGYPDCRPAFSTPFRT